MSTLGTIKICSIITLLLIMTLYLTLLFLYGATYTFCERDILEAFILMLGFSIAKICIIENLFTILLLTLTEGVILYGFIEINETYGCALERYSDLASFSWTLVITIMWIDSIFVTICGIIIGISNCYTSFKEARQARLNPFALANSYGMTENDRKKLLSKKFKFSDEKLEECSICLTAFGEGDEVIRLPSCDHPFHVSCLNNWVSKHATCPYCRSALGTKGDLRNETQQNLSVQSNS